MRDVIEIVIPGSPFPLERILGQNVQVMSREIMEISRSVKAEWLSVIFSENSLPEEHARLLLFPIDDNQYCLQIAYIQPSETQPFGADVCWLQFMPGFFDQYPVNTLIANPPFRFDQTTEQQFSICRQTSTMLEQLKSTAGITPFAEALQCTELAVHLLRRALETIAVPFTVCPVPACRFLTYESEREKVFEARRIIEQNVDQSITIKELSRMVAMNECYLKKGFKALVGKTIHDFQQELRITKAREMLQVQGQTVSEVANSLGYSSISHFSTAFKKATGIKPCELLA
ncbi:MAG TPA: AraC family transcriptional regulator [Flavipsychrobacter sp.]|nr:AraC family transcriptional regulator [Flavipsychrobacter sp.]